MMEGTRRNRDIEGAVGDITSQMLEGVRNKDKDVGRAEGDIDITR